MESCRGAGRGVNRSSERWSDSSSCSHLLSQQELRIWGQRNQRICHQDTGALQYIIRFPFSVFPELGVYEAWQLEGKNRKPLKIMFSEVSQEENQSPGPAKRRGQTLRPKLDPYLASHQTKNYIEMKQDLNTIGKHNKLLKENRKHLQNLE